VKRSGRRADRPTGGPEQKPDRRGFLAGITGLLLGGLPAIGSIVRRSAGPPVRVGIQLYTLRDLLQRDFEGTLAQLAKIGYQEVEFAGLYGQRADDLRQALDRNHLVAPAGHCDIPAVTRNLDQTIAQAKTLGHRYVVVAWLPDEARTLDGYAQVADTFNQAGERLKKAGLTLGYHNHSFEFAPLEGERCGYDILLQRTEPELVTMELDLYWIRQAGRDALKYFSEHQGRFRMVHVKDMAADGAMVDVGQGAMDWPVLLAAARKAGVKHQFVEHDEARDPLAFARTSFGYMSRLELPSR
jgi:sugar phosphate isomerase/epimerase